MNKKYWFVLLACLTIVTISVPRMLISANSDCTYNPESYRGLELTQLSQELTTNGLIGRIHGAASVSRMYVLSVREPNNFFSHREFSLLATDESTNNTLEKLNRHDRICVTGKIIPNPSPQQHIAVNKVKVLESYPQPKGFTPYERNSEIPAELKQQNSLMGKVHAIGEGGKILVVEYKDGVLPIYVTATEYTKDLYRGDLVKLEYQVQQRPQQPLHLRLNTNVDRPIVVLDAIASWNNQNKTLNGKLVKFPRSPQLKFDVYAMEVETKGIKRYFTLINFQDITEFENIRAKLAKIWDENQSTAISGRNMLINPQVTIEATGIANIVSPEQANPQILLDSAMDVKQIESK